MSLIFFFLIYAKNACHGWGIGSETFQWRWPQFVNGFSRTVSIDKPVCTNALNI